ncbi:imidazole glycerol phosphate synthase subunit HisH [Ekhidna sp.]|uniref:imidazole glycerol phosphate synthase subunit HisH n=1 Tax=Ekhidna sp. TaxID=2608089 RepID=UPI003C7977DF
MIAILDYGVGNLGSIKNMLKKVGQKAEIVSTSEGIENADKFILPGVGSFDNGIKRLRESEFYDRFTKSVIVDKKPVLGICLGFQLLFESSEEGKEPGLGWLKGEVVKFDSSKLSSELKIPHMGWNEVISDQNFSLIEGLITPRFYFVHSYHVDNVPSAYSTLTCNYGYQFVCGAEMGNILGVQFHPEKSHKFGMGLLSNYGRNY